MFVDTLTENRDFLFIYFIIWASKVMFKEIVGIRISEFFVWFFVRSFLRVLVVFWLGVRGGGWGGEGRV